MASGMSMKRTGACIRGCGNHGPDVALRDHSHNSTSVTAERAVGSKKNAGSFSSHPSFTLRPHVHSSTFLLRA